MRIAVVPGQITFRWCRRCENWCALDVGVYADDSLIGTYLACERCDPDLFTTDPKEVGGG